jgi:CxxC motif-containing protein (DUF1111 family)
MNKKTPRTPLILALLAASGLALAQVQGAIALPRFGEPLPGLSEEEAAAFEAGLAEFVKAETPETGLGPLFNGHSCAQCHAAPAIGGGSGIAVTRFGRLVDGKFDPMESEGGSLLQQFAIDPAVRETIPAAANVVARRITPPLFGAGLIEAIPDDAILRNASRPKPDGVAGRAHLVSDVTTGAARVGRFGWKAQQATLLAFSADAYVNEMGITNRFFPLENAPNGNRALLARFDRVADPEDAVDPATGRSDIDAAADFMRLLAAPAPAPATASSRAGEALFAQLGCPACHTPVMQTGPSPTPALDRKAVALYSDLLLHDMGTLGDGIAQGLAQPREMRTPPLWGLRARRLFLHDGRAATADAAIVAHDGEAAASRDRYRRLPPPLRRQLLDFLNTI